MALRVVLILLLVLVPLRHAPAAPAPASAACCGVEMGDCCCGDDCRCAVEAPEQPSDPVEHRPPVPQRGESVPLVVVAPATITFVDLPKPTWRAAPAGGARAVSPASPRAILCVWTT